MGHVGRADDDAEGGFGSIEEIRILATLLLVALHVVGYPDGGLRLAHPHPLRFVADLLGNFRMPAFAFVAGYIYCLRPPTQDSFGAFMLGKLRRLAIPGAIAALIFALVSSAMHLHFALPPEALWEPLVYPYAHFWFLQAILVLFVVIGGADIATQQRGTLFLFVITTLIAAGQPSLPTLFSLDYAAELAPFFTCGMCFYRYRTWLRAHAGLITIIAAAASLGTVSIATIDYLLHAAPAPRKDVIHSMALGMSLCALILLHWPHHPSARKLGMFCFTIYLYHVFGTAAARMALHAMGITSLIVHVPLGLAMGLLVPIALHLTLAPWPLPAQLVLGLRRRTPIPAPAPITMPSTM
ncbi:acyltransferase family protein [Sphingobium sp. SYK-6]|uniref:acyltransferase family protein n=1 Tax=Sphingobium sp. (strain NBRC 103272 / SYK-6) TaxID=627192 RepID=UPI000305ECA4|nr:acyltransferase [Sphingobium sp. SYK-6]